MTPCAGHDSISLLLYEQGEASVPNLHQHHTVWPPVDWLVGGPAFGGGGLSDHHVILKVIQKSQGDNLSSVRAIFWPQAS